MVTDVNITETLTAMETDSEDKAQSEPKIKNIDWISCKDFTIEIGEQQIRQYMDTWDIQQPGWLYSLRFLQETELEFKTQYQYEAKWSIPTPTAPIPRATASVYFILQISKIKPNTLPVDAHFLVETNRSKHIPGQTRFREKWLMDVIESKILLMDTVDF
ncbi:A-kinase anchor 14 [Labeo rohita]|uniref:A-kinase anchor 14 n=1 Tax=Labeo rohita TaxID=84645 RepID=A0A498MK91_LABRO|nr:A-kinase anchor protein 14 [Labeo rohita]RXN19744.1 A-kinase anchor 14 [Labeo rohita]RXN32969.1 A-kinase anchor 14 [Labeo rohita]